MNILYISTLCSDLKFKEIFKNSDIKPQQQAQKFHSLLSKGLMDLVDNIYVMSRPPVNKTTKKEVKASRIKEAQSNVIYHYLKVVEKPFLKHVSLFINGFINTIKWIYKYRKQRKIIICDVLNLSISISALLASKICGVKNMAIITDIPDYMQYYAVQKRSQLKVLLSCIIKKICNYFMCKYDCYVILTEQMNDLVNLYNRPFVIIEGMVDLYMGNISNKIQNKYKHKTIIYAGALYKKYGLEKFIKAFMMLENDNLRLWLYGSGEMEQDIKKYEKADRRIRYFGVVPNEEVVEEQLKATLLINPRPSQEEFTKYSFPSKNMEYMVSGTPVLTTPLQGMPKEYYDYVYLFEDETVDGMAKKLKEILEKNKEELHEKGLKSKRFVLEKKNNLIQASKILKMIKENI